MIKHRQRSSAKIGEPLPPGLSPSSSFLNELLNLSCASTVKTVLPYFSEEVKSVELDVLDDEFSWSK